MRIDESSELDESSGEETSDSGSEEESHMKTPKKKARPWRGAKTPTKVILNLNKIYFGVKKFFSEILFRNIGVKNEFEDIDEKIRS